MKKTFLSLFVMVAMVFAQPALTGDIQVNPDYPEEYTVVKGDTLWDISGRFLQEPWRWPEIWQGNPQIDNPHLIYPGDIIRLSWVDGKPVLTVNDSSVAGDGDTEASSDERRVKLTPKIKLKRTEKEPIPAIPLRAINSFFSRSFLVQKEDYESRPYIYTSLDDTRLIGSGEKVFIRGAEGLSARPGDELGIYRMGEAYTSPKHGKKVLGYEAFKVGEIRVLSNKEEQMIATITTARTEVKEGDRIFSLQADSMSDLTRIVPQRVEETDMQGNVIAFVDDVGVVSTQYRVVVVDLGSEHGLETGDVLGVYQRLGVRADTALANQLNSSAISVDDDFALAQGYKLEPPPEHSGVLLVFKIEEKLSYAIVMTAFREIDINDQVRAM